MGLPDQAPRIHQGHQNELRRLEEGQGPKRYHHILETKLLSAIKGEEGI